MADIWLESQHSHKEIHKIIFQVERSKLPKVYAKYLTISSFSLEKKLLFLDAKRKFRTVFQRFGIKS